MNTKIEKLRLQELRKDLRNSGDEYLVDVDRALTDNQLITLRKMIRGNLKEVDTLDVENSAVRAGRPFIK